MNRAADGAAYTINPGDAQIKAKVEENNIGAAKDMLNVAVNERIGLSEIRELSVQASNTVTIPDADGQVFRRRSRQYKRGISGYCKTDKL